MAIQKRFDAWLGNEPDASGMPRYRMASGLITQLFYLPASFCMSVMERGSFSHWVENAGNSEGTFWNLVFASIFLSFMLTDVVFLNLSKTMILHHIVCMISIFIGFTMYTEGFPYYALGVVVMEIGSASCNITLLGATKSVYILGMTLSNIVGIIVLSYWVSSMTSWIGIMLGCILFLPLVFMRQRAVYIMTDFANRAPSAGRA